MDCEQFDQVVMDLLYREADEKQSADAKRHVESCERCTSVLSDLREARKSTVLPLVEAPSGLESDLMDAARQFQKEVPWPRRIGRWVSWAGGYAMRPQLAMAALLLLMIGSSLLLIRARPGAEHTGVVRVTEQGVPERANMEKGILADPGQLPPASVALPSFEHAPEARSREARDDSSKARAGVLESEGKIEKSPTENRKPDAKSDDSEPPPSDAYAEAMALYRGKDYANAYRAFDNIVMGGGANAPSAALHAAKSVRASSGCGNALPRFESVAARFSGQAVAIEAKWEAAVCARILGDFIRARIIYRELAQLDSQRERAERELARISGHGQGSPTPPAANRASKEREQQKKPEAADAFSY